MNVEIKYLQIIEVIRIKWHGAEVMMKNAISRSPTELSLWSVELSMDGLTSDSY